MIGPIRGVNAPERLENGQTHNSPEERFKVCSPIVHTNINHGLIELN